MDKLLNKNRQFIVYAAPEMEWLAEYLTEKQPEWFIRSKIDFNTFPDDTPNIFIHDIPKIRNRHVLFLASFHGYKAKSMQIAAIYVLTRSKIRTLTVSLPFFNTATMERVDVEGQIAMADVDSWMLSSLPSIGSPVEFIIYDLHTLQNRFYLHDGAVAEMATGMNILKKKLEEMRGIIKLEELENGEQLEKMENIAIAFPDAGAQKRFGKALSEYEQIVCDKVRDGDKRIIRVSEGDPTGKHVVIVDDLVQTGGTLVHARNALFDKGAKEVSAFVTHAIFPNESWRVFTEKPFESKERLFTHFFVTDTYPTAQVLKDKKPFTVLSFAEDFLSRVFYDNQ